MAELKQFRKRMMELLSIEKINKVYYITGDPDPRCERVKDPIGLIKALKSLQDMIGMEKTKKEMIIQLKYLIFNADRAFTNYMLHTVIYGVPGVGKTELGKILANIWLSIGLLPKNEKRKNCEGCEEKSKKLKEYRNKIVKINETITSQEEDLLKMSKNYLRLKPSINKKKKIMRWTENGFRYINVIKDSGKIKDTSTLSFLDMLDSAVEKKEDDNFVVASRSHFVAAYLGQTAIKTEKFLEDNRGKVVFIDEAYSLMHRPDDSYGMEALTALNKYMSEHPETPVIFAGYKHLMQEGIFKAQPGLERRCVWSLTVEGYSAKELCQIYHTQLKKKEYTLSKEVKLEKIFEANMDLLTSYGGDTGKIVFYNDLLYSQEKFDEDSKDDRVITQDILEKSLKMLKENKCLKKDSKLPPMYL